MVNANIDGAADLENGATMMESQTQCRFVHAHFSGGWSTSVQCFWKGFSNCLSTLVKGCAYCPTNLFIVFQTIFCSCICYCFMPCNEGGHQNPRHLPAKCSCENVLSVSRPKLNLCLYLFHNASIKESVVFEQTRFFVQLTEHRQPDLSKPFYKTADHCADPLNLKVDWKTE